MLTETKQASYRPTLSKEQTREFFLDEEGYNTLVSTWSKFMKDKDTRKTLSAEYQTLYLILRGKDWRLGFSHKIEDGKYICLCPDTLIGVMDRIENWLTFSGKSLLAGKFGNLFKEGAAAAILSYLTSFSECGAYKV